MPFYKYKGIDRDGKTVKDFFACKDETELRAQLARAGIRLVDFKKQGEKRVSNFFSVSSKVSMKEFVSFTQQLAIMIRTGISISDALNSLRNQNFTILMKNTISEVYEDVLSGSYLSDAFRKHKKIFPSFFCSMVYVGELSGNLPDVLVKASAYYKDDQKTKNKTKSALVYPTFLLVIVVAVFFLLMIYVVPEFSDMLESFGGELPPLTIVVQKMSTFVINNVGLLLGGLIILILILIYFFGYTKKGKYAGDWIKYYFPIVKGVTRNLIITRFCSAFAILLSSGLSVVDCLKSMPRIIDNDVFNKQFKQIIKDVEDGKKLSKSLQKCKIFPPMLIQMTTVGENTSTLEEVYKTVGDYYEEVLQTSISSATALVEPLVIIFLGVVVLLVILAVMLPMFSLMGSIH